jgi:hypothetical protein
MPHAMGKPVFQKPMFFFFHSLQNVDFSTTISTKVFQHARKSIQKVLETNTYSCKCHRKFITLMSEMMNRWLLAEYFFVQKFICSETGIHHRWWSIGPLQHEGRIDVSGRCQVQAWPVWKQWGLEALGCPSWYLWLISI